MASMWSPFAKEASFAPVLILMLAGCSTPDAAQIVHPLETTLGTAVPAAFLAATAMSSLGGTPSPCVSVDPQGSTDGGQSVQVNVQLGPGCPQLFGQTQGGTMVVTGVWTPNLGVFLADFTSVPCPGTSVVFASASFSIRSMASSIPRIDPPLA